MSGSDDSSNQTPSSSIVSRSPADTGRPQEVTIVPQYSNLRNQVLWWNPDTGQPEWRLLTDVEADVVYGIPRELLADDNLPILAGDGLPILARAYFGPSA